MNEIDIAVCDDDPAVLGMVSGAIKGTFGDYSVDAKIETFTSSIALYKRLKEKPFPLVFLDIDMPEVDGIQLGKRLNKEGMKTDIVYVSAREERVFESMQVHPFGFVRKKDFLEDILNVVKQYISAQKKIDSVQTAVFVSHGLKITVEVEKILYFECEAAIQHMYLKDAKKSVEITCRMVTLEEELTPFGFMRVHKGFLVNFRYIRRFEASSIILSNGAEIPVSRRRQKDIKSEYLGLCRKFNMIVF